jgi:ribonucrease Y
MNLSEGLIGGTTVFFVGAVTGYMVLRWKERGLASAREVERKSLLDAARREADALIREAKLASSEESMQLRRKADSEIAERLKQVSVTEQAATDRMTAADRMAGDVSLREERVQAEAKKLDQRAGRLELEEKEARELAEQVKQALSRISGLNPTEAREQLLKQIEDESLSDAARIARNVIEEAKVRSEETARKILTVAIQRYAGTHTSDISTATVALNGDDIKGRIIGREGRNIRAFELATGVTVLIDDTPNAVVLSGFDPVRRAIAREAMERLILDGRIHPTRIEEVVAKVTEEMDETILRAGEDAVVKAGVGPMHSEMVKLLGRLRFRHSFSQNILDHSVEVAQLCGLMASEIGIPILPAKRAGLLHDIGKAVNHEVEGAHALIGGDIARRCGEPEDIINGIASHHEEVPHVGLLGILVSAADAISASRPGARSETMTTYLRRVENLERIGMSFQGVERCYAVQAGREVRVLVRPEHITDDESLLLARNVARRIEEELQYPGQIRVIVLRETRCVEYAK